LPVGQLSLAVRSTGRYEERSPRRWRKAELLILLGYVLVAVALTWRIDANPAVRVPSSGSPIVESDIYLNIWFMRYAATAVAHGHLPALITTAVNAPRGINLMWNTSMLLPGVLLAPVTLLAGPSASLAVQLIIGFAGSAATLYYVMRRWGVSIAAAAIGGAVYGFSPAMLVAAEDHYHLQFAVLPPLIADALLRLATGRGRAVLVGIWLGLLVAAQIFIAEEMLVDTALVCLLLVGILFLSRPARLPARLGGMAAGGAVAAVVALALSVHALLVQFRGPLKETGSPWHVSRYWIDPADFITAPSAVLFHGHYRHFIISTHQWPVETFAYLGWPLLIVVVVALVAFWRDLRIRLAGIAFVLLEWMGIGNHKVMIGSWHYPTRLLPWHWLVRIHILNQVLPNRFPILADGAAAMVLVCAIDRVLASLPARYRWRGPAVACAAALVLLPIVPRPVPADHVLPPPAGWQAALRGLHLKAGAPVLVLPYNSNMDDRANPMEWQAMTNASVSLVGGYCIVPDKHGRAVLCNTGRTLDGAQLTSMRHLNWLAEDEPRRAGPSRAAMTAAIAAWRPAAVITADGPGTRLGRYLIKFFGPPTVHAGALLGWRVQPPAALSSAARIWTAPGPAAPLANAAVR
jgi:hypothetical protein